FFFCLMVRPPPISTLFPYTTLFRSALKLLCHLGYQYLSPAEALTMREGRESNVILTDVLRERLHHINQIKLGRKTAQFNETNIEDRKSTRLNSSHVKISYAVFCLKK